MRKLLFITLFLFLSTISYAKEIQTRNLYQIVVDNGNTVKDRNFAEDIRWRDAYKKAFLSLVFQTIRPADNDIVVIMSAFNDRGNLWTGTAKSFRNRSPSLKLAITNFDHVDANGDHNGKVPTNLPSVLKTIEKNETRYNPSKTSFVFMFSPFLDSVNAIKGIKKFNQDIIIQKNITFIPSLKLGSEAFNHKRNFSFFWVHDSIESLLRKQLENSGIDKYSILTITDSKSHDFLEGEAQPFLQQ